MALNSSCNDVATVASPSLFLTPPPSPHPAPFSHRYNLQCPRMPAPLSTFENKMATRNNKPLISSILRKNRGLWTA